MSKISLEGLSEFRDNVKSKASDSFKSFTGRFGPSGSNQSASLELPSGPSPQDIEAKARADAATADAATKRAAANVAAGVVNERQDDLNRKISEIKRMNTAFTDNGVGWTPNPNSPDAKAFEALQQSKNKINTKLTEAKTAAAAAEAAAVAAEAAAAEAGY
jgi:hypothetical protein